MAGRHDPCIIDEEFPSPPFGEVLERRLSRRDALKAGALLAAGVAGAPLLDRLSVAAGAATGAPAGEVPSGSSTLGFTAIDEDDGHQVRVPGGYGVAPVLSWGDPLRPGLGPFDVTAQTAREQRRRFGFNNDFVAFFPLPRRSREADRGLLWVNHEFTLERLMFLDWDPNKPTRHQVDIAMAAVGGTVVEVGRNGGGSWDYNPASPCNRRITATTPMRLTGPAAGSPWLRTKADRSGRRVLGTFANCAGGVTPWDTVLSAEENFDWFFNMAEYLSEPEDSPVKKAHQAYYKPETDGQDRGWREYYDRFNIFLEPHEPFRFGWVVEVDPYNPGAVPRKRTALGRFKHEGASTTVAADGRAVVYSGEDEENKFIYKFVSAGRVDRRNRHANRDLLDHGTLYAARFSDDGTGLWIPLTFGTARLREPDFVSQADVLVRARQAAALAGATPMDRAEDMEVSPIDGQVYVALTKNTKRKEGDQDRSNPRWLNQFGHLIEITEDGDDSGATTFEWRIFLLCGDPANLVTDLRTVDWDRPEALTTSYFAGNDGPGISRIATPDNLVFDAAGNLWIATDGQGDPERFGKNDALYAVPTHGEERGRVQRFLTAVPNAEVTGPCFTPANDALFVSIQHPGRTPDSTLANPPTRWPGGDNDPPRPSVAVVTKNDGGIIGS